MAREAGLDISTSHDVYNAFKSGDARALAVFQKMGSYLGIMLAGLVNALNPEMIVICGGAAAGWDAFYGCVKSEVNARAFPQPTARVQIVRGMLGDDAGILGAARTAFLR